MSVRITDNRREYDVLLAAVNEASKGLYVVVGITGDKGSDLVTIGAYNEYGSEDGKHPPKRSFLRSTYDEGKEKYVAMVAKGLDDSLAGKGTLRRALDLAGLKLSNDVKLKIRRGILPENAAITIKRKGSSKPLVDTGRLLQSISHEIRSGAVVEAVGSGA